MSIKLKYIVAVLGLSVVYFQTYAQESKSFLNLDQKIEISNAKSANSKNLESSPVFYENGIVFVFARERSKLIDPKIGLPFFELMYSEIGPEGELRRPVSFSPTIRSKFHEGPATFNHEFDEMFFTRTNAKSGKGVADNNRDINLNILSATKGSDDWEELSLLPFCNDEFSVCHPALSEEGDYMIFASDMPGGLGGMDLYMIERKNGAWQIPINLGDEINTPKNEIFPTLHADEILFFSSNGHDGNGGLDIFSAKRTDTNFGQLLHMPRPFNSRKDDLGLIVDETGKYGLMASERKGGRGRDDLFIVRMEESIFITKEPVEIEPEEIESVEEIAEEKLPVETMPDETNRQNEADISVTKKPEPCLTVTGKIRSYESNQLIDNARVILSNRCDGSLVESFSTVDGLYSNCLNPDCRYDVEIHKEGFASEKFNFTPDPDNNALWNIFLKEKQNELFTPAELETGQIVVLNNIYYDFNKSAIQKGAASELETLVKEMKKYPSMVIELISHTDSRGKAQYNLELSERRAFAAKDFLTARGIKGSRIKVNPVGEQQIRNECFDGVECSEEKHRFNRRTEVKVLEIDDSVKFK